VITIEGQNGVDWPDLGDFALLAEGIERRGTAAASEESPNA